MIPAHLHLETACLKGILHFWNRRFRGVVKVTTPLLDSGRDQQHWAGASVAWKQKADRGCWRTGTAHCAAHTARLSKGASGRLSSSSAPANDCINLLYPEGPAQLAVGMKMRTNGLGGGVWERSLRDASWPCRGTPPSIFPEAIMPLSSSWGKPNKIDQLQITFYMLIPTCPHGDYWAVCLTLDSL